MNLYMFNLNVGDGLTKLSQFENSVVNGDWIYFNQDGLKIEALFLSSEAIPRFDMIENINENFVQTFLGKFSPELNESVEIILNDNFIDFCIKLNEILNKKEKIYDLSRTQKWIWTEGLEKPLSKKLRKFLTFSL